MKKILKYCLVIFCFAILGVNIFGINVSAKENISYEYISSDEIINEIIHDKELSRISLYNNRYIGISSYKENSNLFKELILRNDAGELLLNKYDSCNSESEKNILLFFLSQYEIYEQLTLQDKEYVNSLVSIENNILEVQLYNLNPCVYTPNGGEVEVFTRDYANLDSELNLSDIAKGAEEYGVINTLSNPTVKYNCHSYAWYSQNTSSNYYWMNDPSEYYNDQSYIEDEGEENGILCYYAKITYDFLSAGKYTEIINSHSAIIKNIDDDNFDINDVSTLNYITLESKWGEWGLYTHTGNNCPYVENTKDFGYCQYITESGEIITGLATVTSEFLYVKAYSPKTHNDVELKNYSQNFLDSLTIIENTLPNDIYEMYELNVKYSKSYEFDIISNGELDVRLYDEHMQLVNKIDLEENLNKVYFIQNLSVGTYYLRVAYENELNTGTINTEIISRNTAYLSEGENDILINTYNNDDEYNFINHNGPGFYKFSIEATKADGSIVTYPYASLKIYDHMNSSQEDKYNVDGYSELAQSIENNNYMYMYLERNGYYYIHVNMPDASYTSVKLNIERVSVDEIEVASRFDEAFTETLINSNDITEYATGFSIDQTSVFTIDVTTSQTYTGNITFILFRKAYNNDTKEYYIDEVVGDYIPLESDELRKILVEGTYYIGFFGNTSNVPVTIKINRIVTTSEITDQVLVMDLDENLPYGTEVRHNGGEYGEKTITEGFTRHIHFQNVTGVPSVSRYDYSFYSSNKNYATVSEFGTVFAKSVTGNKTVTITAVYKYDPAIIFTIELIIIDDTSNTEKVIETTQEISLSKFVNGKYKLVLDENNSPYPWIQYYNWSVFVPCQADDIAVTIDNYGYLTTSGVGTATLTGTYSINPNVTVIIHINFVE